MNPKTRRFTTLGLFLATLALMLATEPGLTIVWDEGYTLGRETRIRWWFQALADPPGFAGRWVPPDPHEELVQQDGTPPPRPEQIDTRAKLFSPEALRWFWPFAREEPHGHPPFYALLGLVGDLAYPSSSELGRARFGPIVLFSLVAAAIFGFLTRRYSPWAGAVGAGGWVLQPQLFGHGHYAAYDMPLASLWVLALLSFWCAIETEPVPIANGTAGKRTPDRRFPRWFYVFCFGVLCGWAADTKLTGWFVPGSFILFALLYRDRRAWWTILAGGIVAVVVLWAFNPAWWTDPIQGVFRFLKSNLTRGQTRPIDVMFLGTVYHSPNESLPWYNTLVWTLFVTPAGFLLLAITGVGWSLAKIKADRFGVLACLNWFAVLTLRALPHTPGHDGVRQFLSAFGLLAVVAGLGAHLVVQAWGRWGKALAALAITEGILSVALFWPVPVSYYSPLVGGLPGATRLGMEPTYYWDALTPEVREFLNTNTPPGRSILFATNPTSWFYLKKTGQIRPPIATPSTPERPAWLVVQNRPGEFTQELRSLIRATRPAFVYTRWGVPLVWVFPL